MKRRAEDKFKDELIAVLNRWAEESDLDEFEMLSLSVEGLNARMDEPMLHFESDMDEGLDFESDLE